MTRDKLVTELVERDMLDIVTKIARAHHVTLEEIWEHQRFPAGVEARQELWCALFDTGNWSVSRLAKFAERDRTTIRKGIDAHRRRSDTRAA